MPSSAYTNSVFARALWSSFAFFGGLSIEEAAEVLGTSRGL